MLALILQLISSVAWCQTVPETNEMDPIGEELAYSRAIAMSLAGEKQVALDALHIDENSDAAALFTHAVLLLENGELAKAAVALERVMRLPDAPLDTPKMLAAAYLHIDEPELARQLAEQILVANPNDTYAHYLVGVAAARLDDAEQAKSAFQLAGYSEDEANQIQLVVMQAPVDAVQRLSTVRQPTGQRYFPEAEIGRAESDRIFNFTFLFANEYDSNVPLRPTFQGLGSGFSREDSRFLVASFADLKLLDRELVNVGLLASTYNTFQYKLTDFDIEDYMGGAYTNLLLTDGLVSSLRYEFHTTLVNGGQFSNEHRLTPSLTRLGELGHTTLYGEFNPIDNRAPALIPVQNQSADTYRVGATQALYTFGGDGRIYGGYQYAESFAEGTDFDRSSQMVTGRIERPFSRGLIGDADVRYFWDDYQSPNSLDFFDRVRDDERVEFRAGLQKNFVNLPISLRLDYTYINNQSNTENLYGVHFYDYDRHVLSTQLIFSLY